LKSTSYAPLSVERAVDALIQKGVPPNKIVIGAAFYSRAFANTDGLGCPSSGVSPDKSWEDGVCDYKVLPIQGAQEYWDDQAKATYSYDPMKRVLSSYDGVQSIREKTKFVWDRGLAGIIVWESSGDVSDLSSPRCLTRALYDGLSRDPR
jgi:chitinase